MNIIIDIRSLLSPNRSGVGQYAYETIKTLLASDRTNQYFLFYNSYRDVSQYVPNWPYKNVHVVACRYPNKIFNSLSLLGIWPKIDRLIEKKLGQKIKFDCFWQPNWLFFSVSKYIKKILTVHDLSCLRADEFLSLKSRSWHRFFARRKFVNQFDKIIAVSEHTKNDLVDLLKIDPKKITVSLLGVTPDFHPMAAADPKFEEIRKKYNLPDKFALYLGSIEPRKNIFGIIDAWWLFKKDCSENLREYKLILAGGEGFMPRFLKKVKKECGEDIIHIDYVSEPDRPTLYNLARVFVWPSFYEGFGLPVLEAMACGTPVITSFCTSLPEVVGSAGVMVDPYKVSDIALAINEVLKDEELQELLKNRGLERAKRFTWNSAAEAVLAACGSGLRH